MSENKVKQPELPESHILFLHEVARAADRNGMKRFEISYYPHWDGENINNSQGSIKMTYSNINGRGSPAHKMRIEYTANYSVPKDTNVVSKGDRE